MYIGRDYIECEVRSLSIQQKEEIKSLGKREIRFRTDKIYFLTSYNGHGLKNKGSECWGEKSWCLKEPGMFKEFKRNGAFFFFFRLSKRRLGIC